MIDIPSLPTVMGLTFASRASKVERISTALLDGYTLVR